jgi:hypothetical protein
MYGVIPRFYALFSLFRSQLVTALHCFTHIPRRLDILAFSRRKQGRNWIPGGRDELTDFLSLSLVL